MLHVEDTPVDLVLMERGVFAPGDYALHIHYDGFNSQQVRLFAQISSIENFVVRVRGSAASSVPPRVVASGFWKKYYSPENWRFA